MVVWRGGDGDGGGRWEGDVCRTVRAFSVNRKGGEGKATRKSFLELARWNDAYDYGCL